MTGLLAPNGKPSNLTPEQYLVVRSYEFKAWFGDWEKLILTKINDSGIDEISLKRLEDGVSKVVDENGEPLVVYHGTNEQFNVFSKKGKGNRVLGYFFTTDREFSENYGESKLYFLNIKNIKKFNSEKFDSLNTRQNAENNYWQLEKEKLLSEMYNGVFIDRNDFFAGINFVRKDYVAFESNQIKLADGTNTTFDAGNPDIRFEDGGAINKSNDFIGTWEELKKYNPNLWETGILRRSQNPQGATDIIPKDVFIRQFQWQNYGQYDEIEAETIYGEPDNYGYYNDKYGNPITDERTGNYIIDELDYENNAERIKATISNKQLKNNLIDSFQTQEGKEYLKKVIATLPKNEDGTITAYRIGTIGEDLQSYTLSEGMAKTFSNQGTDIMPSGLPSIQNEGYKDYGVLPVNKVKINPKGIVAWSPYDSEILVELKYIKTDNSKNSYADGGGVTDSCKIEFIDDSNTIENWGVGNGYHLIKRNSFKKGGDVIINPAEIECHKCHWHWKVKDGGNDLFICHKCNYDNSKFYKFEGLEGEKILDTISYAKGGRTIAQTPAPKKDQIKGSDKNKQGSSKDLKSAKKIELSDKTIESIKNKVDKHNEKHPNKKITIESAKAVVRRGMGAYSSSHRPTIKGGNPNSRVAWGLARLNAFLYKIVNGKSKSGKYSQDNDLIEELGYKVEKYEIGGIFQGTPYDFNVYSTEFMGTGEGNQTFGWGLYFTDQKAIAERYAYTPNENSFYINGISLKNSKQFTQEEKDIILNVWRELWQIGYSETSRDYLWEILNEIEQKSILLDLEDESVFDKETILEINENAEIYNDLYDKLKNESLQIKSNVVSVTLFKGKNPNEYNLIQWNEKPSKKIIRLILKQLDKENIEYQLNGKNIIFKRSDNIYMSIDLINGNTLYNGISSIFYSDDKQASLFFLRAGIDGIKYKSGTLSGMSDKEGYNYVIFDGNDVTIENKEKYADGGLIVGENDDNNKFPTKEEAFEIIEESVLNTGTNFIDEEGDGMFESKEQAQRFVDETYDFFFSIYSMEMIPVYRGIKADEVDLDPYGIGESWSVYLDNAKQFASHLGSSKELKIISAYVPKNNVDWENAFRLYLQFSAYGDSDAEFELPIPSNNKLLDVKVSDYKNAKELEPYTFENGGEADEPKHFWGSEAGGVLVYCSTTDRYLILLRSEWVLEPNTWGIISGKLDDDETNIKDAVLRESEEEIGRKLSDLIPTFIFEKPNFKFHNFVTIVDEEFTPELNWENSDYRWVKINEMPENLHFGLKLLLEKEDIPTLVEKNKNNTMNTNNPKDTITMDIPLLIRFAELMREDIKTDVALHEVIENLLEIKDKGVLTMRDYDSVVGNVVISEEKMENGAVVIDSSIASNTISNPVVGMALMLKEADNYDSVYYVYQVGDDAVRIGVNEGNTTGISISDLKRKFRPATQQEVDMSKTMNQSIFDVLMAEGGKVSSIKSKKGDIKVSLDENWYLDDTKVELVPVSELIKFREFDRKVKPKYNHDNSRDNINHLKYMFQRDGVKEPIIIEYSPQDNAVLVIEGNHRLNSAIDLGMEYLPARVVLRKYSKFSPIQLKNTISVSGITADDSGYISSDLKPSQVGITGAMPIAYAEGGIIEGRLHSECGDDGCGRKFQVGENGHIIEAERDEAVIVADAFDDNQEYTINGTPSQVASALNVMGGGKNFDKGATIIKNGQELEIPQLKKQEKDTDVDDVIDSGSIIINRRSMADEKSYKVTGSPKQIASAINSLNGNGVVIENGAEIKEN